MTSTDPSLDVRIWAYVRGESGHVDRKKLESQVSSDPAAARRYASIKLLHQRQTAKRDPRALAETDHARATHNTPSASKRGTPARMTSSQSASKADAVILALALLLTIASLGLYLARANWTPLTLLAIRDGLHLGAALLAIALALLRRHSRVWILTLAVGCIAAACATAAMLVR